jgi:hypothetical protein
MAPPASSSVATTVPGITVQAAVVQRPVEVVFLGDKLGDGFIV